MQVKGVEIPQVLPLVVPHYADPGSASYHSLSHCLRTNIFPGVSLKWKSLTKDSYTHHPPAASPNKSQLWFGHRTDEMVQWTERNIMNQKLHKLLKKMEKSGTTK